MTPTGWYAHNLGTKSANKKRNSSHCFGFGLVCVHTVVYIAYLGMWCVKVINSHFEERKKKCVNCSCKNWVLLFSQLHWNCYTGRRIFDSCVLVRSWNCSSKCLGFQMNKLMCWFFEQFDLNYFEIIECWNCEWLMKLIANCFVMEFNWNPVYGIIPSQVFCELLR